MFQHCALSSYALAYVSLMLGAGSEPVSRLRTRRPGGPRAEGLRGENELLRSLEGTKGVPRKGGRK